VTTPVAVIPSPVMERIRDRAEEAYPEECCGFLTGFVEGGAGSDAGAGITESAADHGAAPITVRVLEEIPAQNAAAEEDRRREFLVDPKDLLDVMKKYRDRDENVVGFYHSHPDHEAELSPTDLEFARLWPRTVWLIVPVSKSGTGGSAGSAGRGTEGSSGSAGSGTEGRGTEGSAGQERAWWLPGTEAGRAEMIIHSSGSDGETAGQPAGTEQEGPAEEAARPNEDRTITPPQEKA